jgi:hypothetical protein
LSTYSPQSLIRTLEVTSVRLQLCSHLFYILIGFISLGDYYPYSLPHPRSKLGLLALTLGLGQGFWGEQGTNRSKEWRVPMLLKLHVQVSTNLILLRGLEVGVIPKQTQNFQGLRVVKKISGGEGRLKPLPQPNPPEFFLLLVVSQLAYHCHYYFSSPQRDSNISLALYKALL